MKKISLILLLSLLFQVLSAQNTDSLPKKHLKRDLIIVSSLYTGSMIALNHLWYKENQRTAFHFFNDNEEWFQVDKAGHSYSSFHITKWSFEYFKHYGLTDNQSLLYGTLTSFLMMTPIEWMDGYAASYGASAGDLSANLSGSLLFILLKKLDFENQVRFKYSFFRSGLAEIRPEVLGSNITEELLKDYNSQSYWLSFDFPKNWEIIPEWINTSIGYGAYGMIHAREEVNALNGFESYRRFFLGLDLNLSEIKTRRPWQKNILSVINIIHIPAPVLEISGKGVKAVIR